MEIFFDFIDKVGNLELCKVVEQAEFQPKPLLGFFYKVVATAAQLCVRPIYQRPIFKGASINFRLMISFYKTIRREII